MAAFSRTPRFRLSLMLCAWVSGSPRPVTRMVASGNASAETVRLLLDAGAEAGRSNQFRQSAISMAATEPIARMLVAAGQHHDAVAVCCVVEMILVGIQRETCHCRRPQHHQHNARAGNAKRRAHHSTFFSCASTE